MPPEDARAHPVDGADPCGIDLQRRIAEADGAQRGAHALLDLARSCLGEGDNENLREVVDEGGAVRAGALGERPGDSLRERERLSRACARLDEDGMIERRGNRALLVVELAEVEVCHLPEPPLAVHDGTVRAGVLVERARLDVAVEKLADLLADGVFRGIEQGVHAL